MPNIFFILRDIIYDILILSFQVMKKKSPNIDQI